MRRRDSDAMADMECAGERGLFNRHVLVGLAFVVLGLGMLADRSDGWNIDFSGWWPLFLLFFGGLKVIEPGQHRGRRRSRRSGVWLIAVGAWGLISEAELFGLDYRTSWPLLLIAGGLIITWRALDDSGRSRRIEMN